VDLVRAVAELRDDGVDLTLTLVGGGAGRPRVEALLDELGCRDVVRVTGEVSRADVAGYLADADLYVLPSHSEMFSVATLEAAASGLPVVATRCGGMTDYLPGDATVMVEPDDVPSLTAGIRRAVHELDVRTAAARRAAPALRQRYAADTVGRELADLFDSVLVGQPYTHAAVDDPGVVVAEGE
jgi:glycosyltransferase involved in cell wall biosynthesis